MKHNHCNKVAPVERPADPKRIRYDHGEYRATYDGILVGFYPSYLSAEEALDNYAYELIADGMDRTATELDGGSDPDHVTRVCPVCHETTPHDAWNVCPGKPIERFATARARVAARRDLSIECVSCGDTIEASSLLCGACRETGETQACERLDATGQASCPVCTGGHHIQACPAVLSALYAPLRPDERLQNAQSALLNRIAGTPSALGVAEQAELQALLTPEEEARFVAFRARARAMFVRLGVR